MRKTLNGALTVLVASMLSMMLYACGGSGSNNNQTELPNLSWDSGATWDNTSWAP